MAHRTHKTMRFKLDDAAGDLADITAHLAGQEFLGSLSLLDHSALSDGERRVLPGLAGARIPISGFWNSTTDAILGPLIGNDTSTTKSFVFRAYNTVAPRSYIGEVYVENLRLSGRVDTVETFTADMVVDGVVSDPPTMAAASLVPMERATPANAAEIRQSLDDLLALGVTRVYQEFSGSSTSADWTFFLDECQSRGMTLVIGLDDATQTPVWVPATQNFDLRLHATCLPATAGHPALFAYLIVDEPWHFRHDGGAGGGQFNTARLVILYGQGKALAPNTRLQLSWSAEIAQSELGSFPASQQYTRDLKYEVCMISALEYKRDSGGSCVLQVDELNQNHLVSRYVVQRETPGVIFGSTIQTFGAASGGAGSFCMPSAPNLDDLFDRLMPAAFQKEKPLDFILCQLWKSRFEASESTQDTLADAAFGAQRTVVSDFVDRYE